MDGARFDRITRALAAGHSRRRIVQRLGSGALAGLFGLGGIETADAAACVKPGKKGCKGPKRGRCCDGAACQGGTKKKAGRCTCKRGLTTCGSECVDLTTDKRHCGACNRACQGGETCNNGICSQKLGCAAGQSFCKDGVAAVCPDNQDCACLTDVEGGVHCSDLNDSVCSTCTSNADCPTGQICIDASASLCGCPGGGAGTGNACISATCNA